MTLVVYEGGRLYADDMTTVHGHVCKTCDSRDIRAGMKTQKLRIPRELTFNKEKIIGYGCSGDSKLKDVFLKLGNGTDLYLYYRNIRNTLGRAYTHPNGSVLLVLENRSSVKLTFAFDCEYRSTRYAVNESIAIGSGSGCYESLIHLFDASIEDRFRLATLTDPACDPNKYDYIDFNIGKIESVVYDEPLKKFLARIKKTTRFEFPLPSRIKV